MAVTILSPHPERYTKYVVPQSKGVEPRDLAAYPLPPTARIDFVTAVVDELRAQGHVVSVQWKREQLADWDATRRYNEHSYGSEDGWQPNAKGPGILRFTPGGWNGVVTVDGVAHRLEAQHLRMGRALLAQILRGRP